MKNLTILILSAFLFNCEAVLATSKDSLHLATDTIKGENFIIFGKSANVKSIAIKKNKKSGNLVVVTFGDHGTIGDVGATGAGIPGKSVSADLKNKVGPLFDNISILSGNYEDIVVEKKSTTQNIYTITGSSFPLRLLMKSGNDYIDFELKEAGKWDIDVNYKNN